jgi:hypothetical protein
MSRTERTDGHAGSTNGLAFKARTSTRMLAIAAALSLGLSACLYLALAGHRTASQGGTTPTASLSPAGLLDLPIAARAPVSAALGAQNPEFAVAPSASGLRASNPAQSMELAFSRAGVSLTATRTHVSLALVGAGQGRIFVAVAPANPRATGNRVTFERAGISEWYENGPLGVEQGFTIRRSLAPAAAGPLTLSMSLSSNARATLARDRHSIVLSESGKAALRYAGLSATDATGRNLPTWLSLGHGRLRIHVAAGNARYPVKIDPFIQRPALKVTPNPGGVSDRVAVSADGNTAIVGAPLTNNKGRAFVFIRSGSTWTQQTTLTPQTEGGREFGEGVALSADGNTALVGVPGAAGRLGFVEVWTRAGSTWTDTSTLSVEGEGPILFGATVALSADGDTAIVGAPGEESEAVFAFQFNGTAWEQQGPALAPGGGPGAGIGIGRTLALSGDGDTALLGAEHADEAFVFTRSGGTWTQQTEPLTGSVPGGFFGSSVAVSGDGQTALIGASGNPDAFVFARSGKTFTQQGEPLSGTGSFGFSVALSEDGNTALIGNPSLTSPGHKGAVAVYRRTGESWGQSGPNLVGGEGEGNEQFGARVALSAAGNIALVSGREADGLVWPFEDTAAVAPSVETKPSVGVTSTAANLQATVNPNGVPATECFFEYGTSESYGSTAACSPAPGSGAIGVLVGAMIPGLQPATTYHYRVVAANAAGTNQGSDLTVTTQNPVAPTIKKLSAKKGTAAGGTLVTITGQGFTGTTAVSFGSTPAASFEVVDAGTLRAVSPAATGGTVDVRVTANGLTSPTTSKDHFELVPSIGGISPGSGPAAGGTSVTITGAGFAPGSSGTAVEFTRTFSGSVTCSSTSECTAVSPAHKKGKAKVTAIVQGLRAKSPVKFEYTP